MLGVVALILLIIAGITPWFGWDPIRDSWNQLFRAYPAVGIVLGLVGIGFLVLRGGDEYKAGKKGMFLEIGLYLGTLLLMIAIIILLEKCALRYPAY